LFTNCSLDISTCKTYSLGMIPVGDPLLFIICKKIYYMDCQLTHTLLCFHIT